MIGLIALGWLVCGALTAGFAFAYFQGNWPRQAVESWREDLGNSLVFGLFGPLALLLVFLLTGFGKHGWRLWPKAADGQPDEAAP